MDGLSNYFSPTVLMPTDFQKITDRFHLKILRSDGLNLNFIPLRKLKIVTLLGILD